MKIIIYTDGASRGNPGPASYGFTITEENGRLIYEEGKYIGVSTNNIAEYTAVLMALKYVKEKLKGDLQIELYADSRLVVEQLSGRFKVKSQHLKPLIEQIQILKMELGGAIHTHIPRLQNTKADALANKALDSR